MILLLCVALWCIALTAMAFLRRKQAVGDLLILGVLGAATAGFFWRLLFTSNVWMPAGGGDLAQFLYPTYSFAAQSWRQGVIPLWNPYLFSGAPFVGDSQSGIFYPINLITFFLTSPLAFRDLELLSVLHFGIAGASMYAFLRWGGWGKRGEDGSSGNLTRAAALAGSVAFEFSDLFITHFGNLNLIAVASWMPLVLLFFRLAVRKRRPVAAVGCAVVLAIAFLAGHPQSFLSIVMALGLFAAGEMYAGWTAHRAAPPDAPPDSMNRARLAGRELESVHIRNQALTRTLWPLGVLVVVGLLAFGLSAPSLLPSIEMAQRSVRTTFGYEQAVQYSLPPAQLIGLFVPGFFGRGPQNAWGPWSRVEVGYVGILPLVLALLALVLRRDAATRGMGLLALIGLGLALGGYAILHGWLYALMPVFGQLRAPARFIYLFDFAVAALAAIGFDLLLRALPHPSQVAFKRIVRAAPWAFLLIALAAGSAAFTILVLGQGQDQVLFLRLSNAVNGIAFFILMLGLALGLVVARATRWLRPPAWTVAALALIFFDLFSLGAYVDVSTEDPTRVYDHPDAVAFLKAYAGLGRLDARETGVDRAWPADASILYGLYDVNGDNPLVLADYDTYWQSLGSRSSILYDLLNTRFLIGRKNVPLDRAKFQLAFDSDPSLQIYENSRTLPRAILAPSHVSVSDASAALAAIHAPDFDPLQTAVVQEGRGGAGASAAAESASAIKGTATITGFGPNEIVVETNAANDGFLVLSEVYYPGWKARIDDQNGREVPVLRANFLFRGVAVPAGMHRVRVWYDPDSFKVGFALWGVTLGGLVVWAGLGWRKRRPSSQTG